MKSHALVDARSLAFGRAIAARVALNPELIFRARETLLRWQETCSPSTQSSLREWLDVLDGPLQGVLEMLTAENERATRLRQSNPFAGVLSPQERNAILRQFQSYDARPA
jgi:hypothetical protein